MKKILLLLSLSIIIFAKSINLALAANVSYAIDDLIKEFNKTNPNIKVNIIIGSSGKLSYQIANNAPFDVFMSANMKYPSYLYEKNLTMKEAKVYTKGSLALLCTRKNQDLSKPFEVLKNFKEIAMANPKTAPYGKAAKEVLEHKNMYEDLKKGKLIFGESISQTVFYTTKVVGIGLIAKSALFSPKMLKYKENINWVEIPKDLYIPIHQGIVLLKNTKNKKDAMKFYDFILSSKAKSIFKKYGYIVDE